MREDLFKKQLYDLRVKMTLCQMNTNRGIESEYQKIRREYEEAKKASEAKLGVSEDAEYLFYDVTFVSDGKELDPAEGTVVVQVEFKTIQVDGSAQQQSVLQIDDTASGKVAKDVTAAAPEGSNMSSVKFAF